MFAKPKKLKLRWNPRLYIYIYFSFFERWKKTKMRAKFKMVDDILYSTTAECCDLIFFATLG
jgi:hypothetical protein